MDRVLKRLYWIDSRSDSIGSSAYDGSDSRVILRGVRFAFGITVYGSHVYWTELSTSSVVRADKWNGNKTETLLTLNQTNPGEIKAMHPSM